MRLMRLKRRLSFIIITFWVLVQIFAVAGSSLSNINEYLVAEIPDGKCNDEGYHYAQQYLRVPEIVVISCDAD